MSLVHSCFLSVLYSHICPRFLLSFIVLKSSFLLSSERPSILLFILLSIVPLSYLNMFFSLFLFIVPSVLCPLKFHIFIFPTQTIFLLSQLPIIPSVLQKQNNELNGLNAVQSSTGKDRMKYYILLNSLGNGLISEGRTSEPDEVIASSPMTTDFSQLTSK